MVVGLTVVGVAVVEDGGTVVVVGVLVDTELATDSGSASFLTAANNGVDNSVFTASFDTSSPSVGVKGASAVYSGFARSRFSRGGNPGLTSDFCRTSGISMLVALSSVNFVANWVLTTSDPSLAISRIWRLLSTVCVFTTKSVEPNSGAFAEIAGVS